MALVGSESTGKTELAQVLARHYAAPWVPEYARTYAATHPNLGPQDVDPIARGQMAAEDEGARLASRLLILDTDLVSTVAYSRHYYGHCPGWVERAARARQADLYLLHHPDVPWLPDPGQRDQPERREEVHARFRAVLDEIQARVVDVRGGWEEREQRAVKAVAELLAAVS